MVVEVLCRASTQGGAESQMNTATTLTTDHDRTIIAHKTEAVALQGNIIDRDAGMNGAGVHMEIPEGYVGMLKSKSGLNVNRGVITEGVIDAGYTGSIKVKLYNLGEDIQYFQRGDKIAQLVILPIVTPALKLVDKFAKTERGDNGFGSTGR